MRRGWTALAVAAAVANINFVLQGPLNPSVSAAGTVISELSRSGEPYAWVFRGGDLLAGILSLALAAPSRRLGSALLVWCLVGFGSGTAASALIPLSCPADHDCETDVSDTVNVVHDGLSFFSATAAVVGATALALLLIRRRHHGLSAAACAAGVVAGVLGIAELLAYLPDAQGPGGWVQRLQVTAVSSWVLIVGMALAGTPGVDRPDSSPPSG